ncbi:MAG TPA: hypothetical protein VFR99_04810, partial [Marmoricola sp.]|nr:hypothetical protein [Marmoricola sp.]
MGCPPHWRWLPATTVLCLAAACTSPLATPAPVDHARVDAAQVPSEVTDHPAPRATPPPHRATPWCPLAGTRAWRPDSPAADGQIEGYADPVGGPPGTRLDLHVS